MQLSTVDFVFWVAGFAGHVALLCLLALKRDRIRTFPLFSSFIVFQVLRTLFLAYPGVRHSLRLYFYGYWILAAVDVLLQLAVLSECFRRVFLPRGTLSRRIRLAVVSLSLASIAVAAGITSLVVAPARVETQVVLGGATFCAILLSELFVALVLLSAVTRTYSNTHTTVILTGLGIHSLFSVLTNGLQNLVNEASRGFQATLPHLRIGCYLLCLAYWIVGLYKEAPATSELPAKVKAELFALNDAVGATLHQLGWRGSAL